MHNIFIVIQNEFRTILQKKSFWIMTFIFPLLIIGFNIGAQIIAARSTNEEDLDALLAQFDTGALPTDDPATSSPSANDDKSPSQAATPAPIIYIDEANLLHSLPPNVNAQSLQAYANVETAKAALLAEEIDQYFVIPTDYLETGEVVVITREFTPFNIPNDELISYVLAYNLTGDQKTAAALIHPARSISREALAPETKNDASNPLTFIVPFATMFIFFFLISMSSGYMLQSVANEKENRIVEVLLVSMRPLDLMLGKLIGLSVIASIQVVVWLGGSILFLQRGKSMFSAFGSYTLPPGFMIWAILFFALGYILYASMMGAIGALSPNAREAGQYTFIIMLPLLLPLWLNVAFINDPNGAIATALSLFPLTAPTSMMTRIAAGGVPLWQIILSLAGLAITTYILVLFSARFFRADTLLSTRSFHWKRLVAEFRHSSS